MTTHKNDQKVVVAFPHPGQVEAKFLKSMLFLWQLDALGGRRKDGTSVGGRGRIVDGGGLIAMSSGAVVARARNQIVREFLALDADWLWMVDTDMTFAPTILEDLVGAAHPTLRPVVGGLCFSVMIDQQRKVWPTLYAHLPGSERLRRLTTYPPDAMVPVAATGGACLLIHRTVLERMAEKYPPPRPWFDETPFYRTNPETGERDLASGDEYSEDITFCLRAQACGFPVHVHTGIKLGHVKEWEITETEFLAESAMLAESLKPALPTFAVVASRSRPEMLATLRNQLDGQAEVLVYDNGYPEPPAGAIDANGWALHRMWNDGLDRAAERAQGAPHNVLIVNDDVEVPNEMCAYLEAGLRASDDHWIAYPNHQRLDLNGQPFARTTSDTLAGQTLSGWCFMVRGEAGLRFDERFRWWYGDSDLERQVREAAKFTVAVDVEARHLDPMTSTLEDPARLAQAEQDEVAFAEKWGIDPEGLWLAQHRAAA